MLPVFVFMAVVWLLKNAAEDIMFNAKGKPSPRQQHRQERWKARQDRTGQGAPNGGAWWQSGPARRYLWDLWSDSWADASTRRADRAADRRAAYAAARRQELEDRDAAQRQGTDPQPTAGGPARPVGGPARPVTQPQPRPQPRPRPQAAPPAPAPAPPGPPAPVADEPVPASVPQARTFSWSCPRCGSSRDGFATDPEARADGDQHPCRIPTPTPEQLAAMFAAPTVPEPAGLTGPAAATSTGGPMTNPAPEVSGHDSAKRYAGAMATASDAAVASLEQTIAAMTTGKVGAPAISHLKQAQEHANQMGAALKQAHAVLSRHDAVREGYAAAPDAGDKDWMTRE